MISKSNLNEAILNNSEIVENDPTKLPKGILARVSRIICLLDKKNANGRRYNRKVWEHVFENEDYKRKMANRQILGEMEHPEGSALKLDKDRTSHIVSKIYIDDQNLVCDSCGKTVPGKTLTESSTCCGAKLRVPVRTEFDILPTDAGKFIHILHEAGVQVGASTRADGELEAAIDEDGESYQNVIPEAYEFRTIDHTGDASCQFTEPEKVINAVRSHYESKDINKNVAVALLESVKTTAAKELEKLIEEDKQHPGCKCGLGTKKCGKGCPHANEATKEKEIESDGGSSKVKVNDSVSVSDQVGTILHIFPRVQKAIVQFSDVKKVVKLEECRTFVSKDNKENNEAVNRNHFISELYKIPVECFGSFVDGAVEVERVSENTFVVNGKELLLNEIYDFMCKFECNLEKTLHSENTKLSERIGKTIMCDKKLPDRLIEQVRKFPDTGRAIRRFDFELSDGRIVRKVVVDTQNFTTNLSTSLDEVKQIKLRLCQPIILEASFVDNAIEQAHNHAFGIFWYNRETKEVNYASYKKGSFHDHRVDDAKFVRGRVFKDNASGKNVVVVWMEWKPPRVQLSQEDVESIARGIQNEIDEPIANIVDENGYSLIVESKTIVSVCSSCGAKFNWLKESEEQLGYVHCPKCKILVDIKGKSLGNVSEYQKKDSWHDTTEEFELGDILYTVRLSLHRYSEPEVGLSTIKGYDILDIQAMDKEGKSVALTPTMQAEVKKYLDSIDLHESTEQVTEVIKKVGKKWQVQSHKGRNLGTYSSEGEAKKRLGQIEYFKHKNESVEESHAENYSNKDGSIRMVVRYTGGMKPYGEVYLKDKDGKESSVRFDNSKDSKTYDYYMKHVSRVSEALTTTSDTSGQPANAQAARSNVEKSAARSKEIDQPKNIVPQTFANAPKMLERKNPSELSDIDLKIQYYTTSDKIDDVATQKEIDELNSYKRQLRAEMNKRGIKESTDVMGLSDEELLRVYRAIDRMDGKTGGNVFTPEVQNIMKEIQKRGLEAKVMEIGERITPNYILWNTQKEMDADVVKMGFVNTQDFIDKTGVTFNDIKGEKFELIHNRVFPLSESVDDDVTAAGDAFKDFVLKVYRHPWTQLSDETLRDALAIYNNPEERKKYEQPKWISKRLGESKSKINEGLYVYEVTDGKETFNLTSIKPYKEGEVVYNGNGRVVKVVKMVQVVKEANIFSEPDNTADAFDDNLLDKLSKLGQFTDQELLQKAEEVRSELGEEVGEFSPDYIKSLIDSFIKEGYLKVTYTDGNKPTYTWLQESKMNEFKIGDYVSVGDEEGPIVGSPAPGMVKIDIGGGKTVVRNQSEIKSKKNESKINEGWKEKIDQYLRDNWDLFLGHQDALRNLIKVFGLVPEEAEMYVGKLEQELGKVPGVSAAYAMSNEKVEPSDSPTTGLSERLVVVTAERDQLANRIKELTERYQKDSIRFANEINQLKEDNQRLVRNYSKDSITFSTELGGLKSLFEKTTANKIIAENTNRSIDAQLKVKTNEAKVLNETLTKVKTDFDQYKAKAEKKLVEAEKALIDLKSSHLTEMNDLKKKQLRENIRFYVDVRAKSMGLKLHENIRALLESANSVEEVDALIKTVQDEIREGLAHATGTPSEIVIGQKVDGAQADISGKVGKVLNYLSGS